MRFVKFVKFGLLLLLLIANICLAASAPVDIKLDVKEFQLENGMMFLIVERPATPQVACRLAIRSGSALEQSGKTGIAHLLEHMMFKGTKNFGTLDVAKDQQLQKQIEDAYQTILSEKQKRNPDPELIKAKRAEMERLRAEVQKIYIPQVFSSQLGKNGAVGVNAFTSKDQTQYLASVPSDMLEQWFSIVSEQLFEPSWREFYVEKEVVQREWAFRYINDPGGAAWLDLSATAYSAHPYRNPTIGWKSDMEKFSTRDAVEFHQKYYTPSNSVCVLVGDVTVKEAKKLAETYFARYPSGRRAPESVTREPPQQGPRKSIRFLKGARTPLVRVGYHTAQMGTPDFYALDAMIMVLSHGRGARMTHNIINKGLGIEAWAYNPDNRYGGMLIVGGSPNEPQDLKMAAGQLGAEEKREAYLKACEKLESLLVEEAAKFKTEMVSSRELARIKKLNQRDFLDRMRSNESLAGTLATLEVQTGWRYMTQYLERLDAVTPEDIREVAQKYIRKDNQTTVYVIPGGQPEKPPAKYTEIRSISGGAAANVQHKGDRINRSEYDTRDGWKHPLYFRRDPQKIKYPPPQIFDVEKVTVFYLPDRELPLIDLTILIKAGSVDVDVSKTGLTDILNSVIVRGGTETLSPNELALVLDENAIQLGVSVDEEQTTVHLSVMKADWEKGLELLQAILTRPGFDPEVLQVVKNQGLVSLKRQGGDAQSVAMRESKIWHFKNHPYGRDPLMGLQTIPSVTREDLKRFLKTYFVPGNMTVAIAGDIDRDKIIAGLKPFFQAFPETRAPQRKLKDPAITSPVLALVNKPGQVQSQIILSLPAHKRSHPDYWKTSLLMNIFGGNDSLMYKRLRDDLGLVYSAGFFQTYKWQAGQLLGYIGCKGDQTGAAIIETIKVMDALRKDIPERELELKRLDALNSFVFNVDTKSELVDVYGRYHLRKEPLDTLEKIQDAYMRTTKEELHRIAGELLDPAKIQILVVADKNIKVPSSDGKGVTLEEDLKTLAHKLDLPFQEIKLR
ncbi:MAG: insulinase family protein [Desulfobacterales bacterium]|nr:insulinase family protein [Desulfobacterales bacterium]